MGVIIRKIFVLRFVTALLLALLFLSSVFWARAESISLNFRDTDIHVIIESVAKITKKNIIIDPRVNASVTIISQDSLDEKDLYDAFLFILGVYGYTAVEGKYATVILPSSSSSTVTPQTEGKEAHSDITEIITISNVPVSSVAQVLQPFFSGSTLKIFVVPNSNRLILSGQRHAIKYAKRIIEKVDRTAVSSYDIIKLSYASSNEVLSLLKTIFPAQGSTLKLQADSRTNRIIVVTDSQQTRLAVRAIVGDLDKPIQDGQQGNLRVFYLRYAKAEDLAPTLNSLMSSKAFSQLGVSGTQVQGGNARSVQQQGTQNKIAPHEAKGQAPQFSLVADKSLNSIVVIGDNNIIKTAQSLIDQLDIPRRQVAIELVIAEVSDSLNHELGTDLLSGSGKGLISTNLTQKLASTVSGLAGSDGSKNALAGSVSQIKGIAFGGASVSSSGNIKWAALVSAIDSDTKSRILSTPFVTVMDNQESTLNVGEERPFVTGSYTQTGDSGSISSPFQTIERKNVGIQFTVKPQINQGNTINLEIKQKISSVKDDAAASADNVITTVRSIDTSIMANDQDIIAMGGLMQEDTQNVSRKVPVLGSIPILGWLFRYEKKQAVRRSLVVFIRPRILSTNEVTKDFSRAKYERLNGVIETNTGKTLKELQTYFSQSSTPTKPEINEKKKKNPVINSSRPSTRVAPIPSLPQGFVMP